jgi:hypothetical protein
MYTQIMWIALYVMLLECVDQEQMQFYQAKAPTSTSMRKPRTIAYAYVDDLVTITCNHTAFYWQQRHADWLFAFCAFSGLQLHPDKIVAIELGKKCPRRPEHIIVHDHSWSETACQIVRCDGRNLEEHDNINLKFVKYLGTEIDLEATGIESHNALL